VSGLSDELLAKDQSGLSSQSPHESSVGGSEETDRGAENDGGSEVRGEDGGSVENAESGSTKMKDNENISKTSGLKEEKCRVSKGDAAEKAVGENNSYDVPQLAEDLDKVSFTSSEPEEEAEESGVKK
jgi:hypothetical protein